MTEPNFHFLGVGEHDFRPRDSDSDDWLECVYCGVGCTRDAIGIVGGWISCYQEQLLTRDLEGDHAGPRP